ncbi:mechanosensitive ion channel family protein (plasmid) [Halorientalis pallida]|uniref:mechanosensitive ion channel family protein n=1 Tax=Halorientalis pallida TaxID=2479928 RepID=UPI003C6F77C0
MYESSVTLMRSHAHVFLQAEVPDMVSSMLAEVVAFLPRLVGAILILVIGWLLGVGIGKAVGGLTDRIELDQLVLETPLGRLLGGTEQAISQAFGATVKWFVVALSVLAAADVLAITLLSEWIQTAVSYLPAFVGGLIVIVAGFVVADFVGDAMMRTRAATQTAYTSWFAAGTRMFLYFTAVVIGLDTMGIDVSILFVFARALAYGLGAAMALGLGIAVGWGGHRYVANNIDRWIGQASSNTPKPSGSPEADGGRRSRATRNREPRTSGSHGPPAPSSRNLSSGQRRVEDEDDQRRESTEPVDREEESASDE